MVGGWRMPTGKFYTHYLAARQGGKGTRAQQRKRPTYNTPARVLYVGECRNLLKYVILGYITIILIFFAAPSPF